MQFQDAIRSGFSNYITVSGRASRSEYWYWVLFAIIVALGSAILDAAMFGASGGPIESLTSLILFLPGLAVSIRRLHDIDRTGWWFLIAFTLIGIIVLWIWACTRGTIGPNRFGPDPLAGEVLVSPPVSA